MTSPTGALLEARDLHVAVDDQPILKGLNLTVRAGEIHAIMGPNGSGKSTLANVLAGRPGYVRSAGSIRLDGVDITEAAVDERAHHGLFLGFQYPVEIPGVSNLEFLKAALDARANQAGLEQPSAARFIKRAREVAAKLQLNPDFLKRGVNEGFSGGEKKRNEILQMLLLEPRLAVLDETDSGLDIDALQVVADGINAFRSADNAVVLVTHYQRILNHVVPDRVHVLMAGRIVRSGDQQLAQEIEKYGYAGLGG